MSTTMRDLEAAGMPRRNFDATDDCCVFIDDTFSQEVADKVIHGCSPSAKAFLSPQRQTVATGAAVSVDVVPFGGDDDDNEVVSGSSITVAQRHTEKPEFSTRDFPFPPPPPPMAQNDPEGHGAAHNHLNSINTNVAAGSSTQKRRRFSTGRALMDMTNQREDSLGRRESSSGRASIPLLGSGSATCTTPKVQIVPSLSPSSGNRHNPAATPSVPLADLLKMEQQRDRYKKMYEHQKDLAEKAMVLEGENYDKLQAKIVEVVALQSRCEETKRFVRQLKKEILGVRQRELPVHNKIAEDCRLDVLVKEKFSKLLAQQRENFEEELAQTQDKLDSVENLLADVSTLACVHIPGSSSRGASMGEEDASPHAHNPVTALDKLRDLELDGKIPESIRFDVKKLDRLLTESYYESTALVNELRRARRETERETDRRMDLEGEMGRLRKKHQDVEIDFTNERRRMMISDEKRAESHATIKSEVLTMREELIRIKEEQQQTNNPQQQLSTSRGRSISSGGFSSASSSDDDCYRVHYNHHHRASSSESCPRPSSSGFQAQGSRHAPSVSPMVTMSVKA